MTDIDLHVGYDPIAAKTRVLEAIRRAEAGAVVGESHVTFESWDGLARTLTGKRLDLLRLCTSHRPPASPNSRVRWAGITNASMRMWNCWQLRASSIDPRKGD